MTLKIYHIDKNQHNTNNQNSIHKLNHNVSTILSQHSNSNHNQNKTGMMILLHSQHCGHCLSMKNDWNTFENNVSSVNKQHQHQNQNVDVYTVENDFIHEVHPSLNQNIIGYPSILGVVNGKLISFDSKLYPRDTKHFMQFYNDIQHEMNTYKTKTKNTRKHLTPYPVKNNHTNTIRTKSKTKSKSKSKTKSRMRSKSKSKSKSKTKSKSKSNKKR